MIEFYNQQVWAKVAKWELDMQKKPGLGNRLTSKIQNKINSVIPDKIHKIITGTIKQMVRGVLFGAGAITGKPQKVQCLELTEIKLADKIKWYKNTAAAEGGIAGAGGFLLALADFPVLISIKIKMLYDIAASYGFDTKDYKERIYLLHIFQLAFSSQKHRNKVFLEMKDWKEKSKDLPEDINKFDWLLFQQQYRDYIDLAKMAQLIPVIGAAVGLVVNYRLLKKLEQTAMNAYRMRLKEENYKDGLL